MHLLELTDEVVLVRPPDRCRNLIEGGVGMGEPARDLGDTSRRDPRADRVPGRLAHRSGHVRRRAMDGGGDFYCQVLRMWTSNLVVFTNGRSLSAQTRAALEANAIPVIESRIQAIEADGDRIRAVRTVDGQRIERDAGFIGDEFAAPATPFAEQLGVGRKEDPFGRLMYETKEGGKTCVDRLYLVGDAHRQFGGLSAASYDGATCI